VRGEDFVARLGGDEFIVIAPPHASGSAESLARRILATIRQPMILAGGLVVVVGLAIGTAELAPGEDPVAVLRKADAHMYSVKSLRTSRAAGPGDVDLEHQRMATSS
jgi:diguanylate cyclase (GGDEF)-like protein